MAERSPTPSGRPLPGEYAAYAQADIDAVAGIDAAAVLAALAVETHGFLASLTEDQVRGVRYAPAKWTLKELLGHITDDERVFSHRAFSLARGEVAPLPGFDEKVYAAASGADRRLWADLLEEYRIVRAASVMLFRSLSPAAWIRHGEVNGYRATPRGLAFHIAGHELHHMRVLRERYLPLVPLPR